MAPAWLDSLSEDWVSQPGSDASGGRLHSHTPPEGVDAPRIQEVSDQIAHRDGKGSSNPPATESSPNALNERSASSINIPMKKVSSGLSQEVKADVSRSMMNDVNGSVVYKSLADRWLSGNGGQTPEWKKRLVYGEIPYGEQRDLFCSAAAGLQDMFNPPSDGEGEYIAENGDLAHHLDMTLPSSPPTHPQPLTEADLEKYEDLDDEEEDYPADTTPSPSPRRPQKEIQYKLNESSPIPRERNINMATPSDSFSDHPSQKPRSHDASCPEIGSEENGTSRKFSGQSDVRNEDFSPILIGKHSGENGEVGFAPIEVPGDQLWQKLERLRVNQMLLESQADLRPGFEASPTRSPADADNTEDNVGRGNFADFRRGGDPGNGSFYNRGLTSDIVADSSEMLPEESLQASTPKQFPSVRTLGSNPYPNLQIQRSPSPPRVPFPSPEKRQIAPGNEGPSEKSPLKLFGPYDTFTNQTLLRRISQFEEGSGSPTLRSRSSFHGEQGSDQVAKGSAADASVAPRRDLSRFGQNDLDGYEFRSHLSDGLHEDSDDAVKDDVEPNRVPLSPHPFRDYQGREPSPEGFSGLVIERRRSRNESLSPSRKDREPAQINDVAAMRHRDAGSEGKRPRTSPSKDPTPKRRRTLHRSDIAFGREAQLEASETANLQEQPPLPGKKRRDALPGGFEVADPSVLAGRTILVPQSPNGSRNSSASHTRPRKSPLRALQKEQDLISSDAVTETDRKPSIRTQDFVDQAAQIMAMIRNQVRPDLGDLEESEEESPDRERRSSDAASDQDTTNEPFSRPPSREGKPAAWVQPRQDDPELLIRLKKYQELSDVGDIISSSMRSIGPAKSSVSAAQGLEKQLEERNLAQSGAISIIVSGETLSDLPNVRITNGLSHDLEQRSPSREYPSNSSTRSGSRNYPSASSRSSESRQVIMPESVSHLIPDRVGSMCLDKDKNVWIKKKESLSSHVLPSEDSEEDPFASIPDLSVDMTKEMQNLRLAAINQEHLSDDNVGDEVLLESPARRSVHADHLAPFSNGPFNQITNILSKAGQAADDKDLDEAIAMADAERGTSRLRRNLTISFSSPIASVIRDLPSDGLHDCENELARDAKVSLHGPPYGHGAQNSAISRPVKQAMRWKSNHAPSRQPSFRDPVFTPRPVSRIDEQDEESTVEFCNDNRQLSLIGEQSMISLKTPEERRASLSLMIGPDSAHGALAMTNDDSALIGRAVGKLSLSPLSEFTLNNPDQSFGLEVSYIMGHRHLATGNGSKKVLSMTIRELVDRLGEAEPQETFWEDIVELDLHDKHLTSLHMLDEFCGKLVRLDVSVNSLGHLDGVPSTVRELKVSHNMLTELTSWDHLMNLQYVDISNNEVTTLSALKNLVHLRSVKADDNQLTSLEGLDSHDGLLSLRARNNKITEVDFDASRFVRLQDLDLSNNDIISIEGLDRLPVLTTLKLSKNRLKELPKVGSMESVRHVDVSENELSALDVGGFPNLHSLHADRNRIQQVRGFGRTRRLDSLSLREQRGQDSLDLGFLASAYEVRKLFLSGNHMSQFAPQVDFLNLQLLELANCGLRHLPEKMGQLMPNLRTLNVNFNAIDNLAPLQYISRLKKLLAAGNRLADSTLVTELLTDFPHLTQVDIRDNPMTLGFYAPLQVLQAGKAFGPADMFVLPDADATRDGIFSSRMDEATRLRKRLHQVVFVAKCRRLRKLDGLAIRREDVLGKDELLQALIDDGLVPDPDPGPGPRQQAGIPNERAGTGQDDEVDEETVVDEQARAQLQEEAEYAWQQKSVLDSSRWSREDSFA